MNAKTKLCCLIGQPVEHSLSPLIHNTIAQKMGMNLVYTAFDVDPHKLENAILGAVALGFLGLNVTVPHKCNVIPYLKQIDPLAESIGAVNTLVAVPGGYCGYNTDIIGLERQLIDEGVILKANDIIIIGAGGASKAITYLCASRGARRIYLLNRTLEKAEALAEEVNHSFGDIVIPYQIQDYTKIPKGKYAVIQTSSVGLFPNIDQAPIEEDEFYKLVDKGIDIIFNPGTTKFMEKCKEAGAEAYNGLKMLLYQGIAAFELWNHVKVSKELADEILETMKKEMNT